MTIKTKLLFNTYCETRKIQRKTSWHRQEACLMRIVIIWREKEIRYTYTTNNNIKEIHTKNASSVSFVGIGRRKQILNTKGACLP